LNPEYRRGSWLAPSPTEPGKIVYLFIVLFVSLLGACQVTPTPTLVPIPTATYIPTETETPPAPSPSPTGAPIRAVVTDTLRVRDQPSLEAKILGRLKKDSTIMLLARKDDNQWYAIEYPPGSGKPGWIFADIVVPDSPTDQLPIGFTSPAPPLGSIFANVIAEFGLRVRTGPGLDYDAVAKLPFHARVALLARSEDGQWYEVADPRDPSKQAWIAKESDGEAVLQLLGSADQMSIAAAPPTPTPGPTPIPRPTRTPGPPGTVGTGRILASSNRGGGYDLYSFAENGAVRVQLTRFHDAYGARFSPDGNRVVFSHVIANAPAIISHIFTMNSDGSNTRDVSSSAGGASDTEPDWSPDGSRLAFVRTPRAGAPEIWVMNTNGSGPRRVIALSMGTGISSASVGDFSVQPRWSPDGGRLAYAAVPSTQNLGAPLYPNIFVVNVDGTHATQLTDNDLINSSPVWSPDGKQIIWSAKDFINRQNWRVWAMSASGDNQRTLISQLLGDPNNGVQAVEWLGNRLLLAGWAGNWNAYFSNSDGSKLVQATTENADDRPTDWAP
jgi:Tol biopolymer transport system component